MKKIIYGIIFLIILNVASAAIENGVISISLVNQDPDPAIASDVVEIRIGVENLGGSSIENLYLELKPEYPFSLVSGEDGVQKVGSLSRFQQEEDMKIVKYKLRVDPDANAGSYDLDVHFYEFGSPLKFRKSISIDIKNKESAEVIHIDKSTLVPGKESTLKFTINNVGNSPLRDMKFNWENSDSVVLPVGSDNTRYIKYLEIGESAELDYMVIADTNADPGLYKLDLTLIYQDAISSNETTVSTIAGVYVGGSTDFEISYSESTIDETSFSISNIGSNPAYSVSVVIPKQNEWKISGSNSVIIGNLNNGDYTVASFKLSPKMNDLENTKQPNKIMVEISYTNTMGERKTVEKEVILNLATTSTTRMKTGMKEASLWDTYKWHILAVVFVLLFVYYYKNKDKFRKKTKK